MYKGAEIVTASMIYFYVILTNSDRILNEEKIL